MTIVYFILSLGILVSIHEFGHFIMAKIQGIGVEIFSIGFGPKIFSFKRSWRGETEYRISILPLGGYVKLHGDDSESPQDAPDSKEKKTVKDPASYSERPILHRFPIVFAGPFMNLLLAFLIMPVVFLLGRYEPAFLGQKPVIMKILPHSAAEKAGLQKGDEILSIDSLSTSRPEQAPTKMTWKTVLDETILKSNQEITLHLKRGHETLSQKLVVEESPSTHTGLLGIEPMLFIGNDPVIDEVSPDSPAEKAGLKPGDKVLSIDGTPIETWTAMSDQVSLSGGKPIAIEILRGDRTLTLSVTPKLDESSSESRGRWLMGVRKSNEGNKGDLILKKYSLKEALVEGSKENIKLAGLTLSVLKQLVTAQLSYKTLGGPIRIAQASAMAAKSGLSDFLYFLAFLSMQLGVLNLLPIPALDGGHLLFFGIEAVTRRPPSPRVRSIIEQTGFFALLSLMLLVTLNDVNSVWGFRNLLNKIVHLF